MKNLDKKISYLSGFNTLLLILLPVITFTAVNFFPILYPELNNITDSNFWPTVIIIFKTIVKSCFIILLPGLVALIFIQIKPLKEIFSIKDIDIQSKSINFFIIYPILIFCIYLSLIEYYCNLSELIFTVLYCVFCLAATLIAYRVASSRLRKRFTSNRIFFLKKGILIAALLFAFYFCTFFSLIGLAFFIKKYASLQLKSSHWLEFAIFTANLLLFALPSLFILLGFTRKSKDYKYWIINTLFLVAVNFFLYTEWYVNLLKPQLRERHYAFFDDINYYFDKVTCTVFKENKIKIKQLKYQICIITENFETTSAIGSNLILTFKNNKRITVPKPKHYSQVLRQT
jgi:hypothetical protein